MDIVLSVVTGTYNRLPSLQLFVDSVRRNMPTHFPYEIIVVDGGSTDGTIEWCETQADIVLIQHGKLEGAIKAFCDGAYAAKGTYVMMGNDDVALHAASILPAIVHLERTPTCGAVVFKDNRPADGYAPGYKVQTMDVSYHGAIQRLPYVQVGIVRRALGDVCGWWGYGVMPTRTYGGDNYLSARLYELGYSIDVLDACKCDDNLKLDTLREINYQADTTSEKNYYDVYPTPPVYEPIANAGDYERLRTLYLPIYDPDYHPVVIHNKRGLREALQRVGMVWEVDYLQGKYNLERIVELFQPHLVITQCHNLPVDLSRARALKPGMVVVNWNGDVWANHLLADDMVTWLQNQVDIQLTVNESVIPAYKDKGIKSAYWQVGYEPVSADLPDMPSYDAVFLGNCYSPSRRDLGDFLRTLPYSVGLYGYGWKHGDGNTTYLFEHSAALCRNAKIVIGDNQYPSETGFVSNRLFETLAHGAFLLHQEVSDMQRLTGYVEGKHYISWTNHHDLHAKLGYWLAPERYKERAKIAKAAQDFTRKHHSFDVRVQELSNIVYSHTI